MFAPETRCRKPEEEGRNYKAMAGRRWLALVELSGHRCSRETLCPMLGDHTWPLTALVVPDCDDLHSDLLTLHHYRPLAVHLGLYRMTRALAKRYWWEGMCHDC